LLCSCTGLAGNSRIEDFSPSPQNGAIQMLKKGMGEAAWKKKEVLATRHLEEKVPKLPVRLSSDAWLGLGLK
jgi:hypothetical protein